MPPVLAALVAAGILSREEAERINRQLDSEAARQFAEQTFMRAAQAGLGAQQDRLLDLARSTEGRATRAQLAQFWDGEDDRLYRSLEPEITDIASEQAVRTAVRLGDVSTWRMVNESLIDWAQTYYANADSAAVGSIPNLNLTSRTRVLEVFTDWQRGELQTAGLADGLPQLVRGLEPVFGPERAEIIASTEVTRIHAEGTRAAAQDNEFVTSFRWQTARDELVCPVCSPLQGLLIGKGDSGFIHPSMGNVGFPPAHPRCRCDIVEETEQTRRR